jgi:phosphoribosylformylglycinamidine (FGAM) synthase-like amidotransferase family enzyme
VAIYNKLNQQIGKAAKQVTVLAEYQMHFTGVPSTNNIKGIIINNEKLLLMPPHSEVILNRNTYISTVAPCNREDPTIKVVGDHQLVSGESSNQP